MKQILLIAICLLPTTNVAAAEIYKCRTHQGGEFWSSNKCDSRNSIMIDAVKTPDGMPFKEQAAFADQLRNKTQTTKTKSETAQQKQIECSSIDRELNEIWSRYKEGQHVETKQVDKDQVRQRELKRKRAALNCESK